MTQPKAKWSPYDEDTKRIWTATVGCFYLDVDASTGACEIAEWEPESASIGETLWDFHGPTPCDVVDLMRITEAELARRLRGAAETMDAKELVAQMPLRGVDILATQLICDPIADLDGRCGRWIEASHQSKQIKHIPGADCSACEVCGIHCLPIGSVVDGRCKCCGPKQERIVVGPAAALEIWRALLR